MVRSQRSARQVCWPLDQWTLVVYRKREREPAIIEDNDGSCFPEKVSRNGATTQRRNDATTNSITSLRCCAVARENSFTQPPPRESPALAATPSRSQSTLLLVQ